MKINKSFVFAAIGLVSILVGAFIFHRIKSYDNEFKKVQNADELVITQLKKIRVAQKAYFDVHNRYASTWDSLVYFIENDKFAVVENKEKIEMINGEEKISTVADTLELISVYDSLQSKLKLPKDKLHTIADLPQEEGQFKLYVSSRNGENYIEVTDPKPVNPRRKPNADKHFEIVMKPLRFGSKSAITTKGNWE